MAGVNDQAIYDSYISSNPSYYMIPNYTHYYSPPCDQRYSTAPYYADNSPTVNGGFNGTSLQPLNQVFPSSNPAPHVNNNIPSSENESFCNPLHRYVGNNENPVNSSIPATNCNSSNTVHSPSIYQTLAQTPSAPTYPNNATDAVPNAGCVIIIMNANINLERLLSSITKQR